MEFEKNFQRRREDYRIVILGEKKTLSWLNPSFFRQLYIMWNVRILKKRPLRTGTNLHPRIFRDTTITVTTKSLKTTSNIRLLLKNNIIVNVVSYNVQCCKSKHLCHNLERVVYIWSTVSKRVILLLFLYLEHCSLHE